MFDFFKKSRAFKFLCSACLLCSLGSFVTSAEGESTSDELTQDVPTKIGDAYVQAPLGSESNRIALYNAKIDSDTGLMREGTLKYKITTIKYSKGDQTNKTLDDAWEAYWEGKNPSSLLISDGWRAVSNGSERIWYDENSEEVARGTSLTTDPLLDGTTAAWRVWCERQSAARKLQLITADGWTEDAHLDTQLDIVNPNENSKLALSLRSEDDSENSSIGVTAEIDLSGKNYSLKGAQFYESDSDDVIADESAAKLSLKPGVYPVYAILTEQGDKTLLSGPTIDKVVESSEESA